MSVLPVAGCKFTAVFLGKVALDVVGLGVVPSCLRVDSEETLLTLIDDRAQLARAASGVTPVDSSEEGAPVRELIRPSVLGEPLVDSLQEPMPVEKRLEYAIQVTASVWEPFEHYVVSGDYSIVWGFPLIDSAAVDYDTGAVELDDLILRRTSFLPDELSVGRDGDYIWLALLAGLLVLTRSVTGSLRFGSPHRLVCSCFSSTILSLRWLESVDVPQVRHCRTTVGRNTPSFALHVAHCALRDICLCPVLL